jgi:hypothetical protein
MSLWKERVLEELRRIRSVATAESIMDEEFAAIRDGLERLRSSSTNWCDDRANYGGLYPLHEDKLKRVSFLRWYRSWLDDALDTLRQE